MLYSNLTVNVSSVEKIVAKKTQDTFKGEEKGLYVHMGDGFAFTLFGQNMVKENKDINVQYDVTDKVTGQTNERTLSCANKTVLGMNVILHAYLPNAVPGNTARVYAVDTQGNKNLVATYKITKDNRICWSTDTLQKYVIEN